MLDTGIGRAIRLATLGTAIGLLVACGGSPTASPTASSPDSRPAASTTPAPGGGVASTDPGGGTGGEPGASTDNGPIGGDIGDRAKGSVQAQVTGGLTSSIDLPFAAALGQFQVGGANGAYLPFTDTEKGTLFLTLSENQLLVQYAGPENVGLTNGATPCELRVDALDGGQAKGSFTCKGMLLIKGESMGSADMTGTFDAHK